MIRLEFSLQSLICVIGFNFIVAESSINPADNARDYCQSDYFNVTCPGNDEVILMTYAQYGRMRTGSCVTLKGQIGCSIDVLHFFDRRCSGRKRCAVYVSDPELHKLEPCQKDYTAYLSASFVCIKGTPLNCQNSRLQGAGAEGGRGSKSQLMPRLYDKEVKGSHHDVTTSGYLLSAAITEPENPYPGFPCPWHLVAGQDQKIRLILLSFGSTRWNSGNTARGLGGVYTYSQPGGSGSNEEYSYEIGEVLEPDTPRTVISTGGSTREVVLFESVGHDVSVKLLSAEVLRGLSPLVIRYEVVGCARLAPPDGTWVEVSGNVATVRCNHSKETWYLTCSGSQWIGTVGETANCTRSNMPMRGEFVPRADSSFPYGNINKLESNCEDPRGRSPFHSQAGVKQLIIFSILVVVAIGVALGVVIGGILLSFVAYYMRRQNKGSSRYPVSSIVTKPLTNEDLYQDAYKELNLSDTAHRSYCGGAGGRFGCTMTPQGLSSPYMGSIHHGVPAGRLVAYSSPDHPQTAIGICTCSEPLCSATGECNVIHSGMRDSADGAIIYEKAGSHSRMNSNISGGVVL